MLIATSNRSEAAVGYTTMDGDSSGGLAPISGVDKSFVLAWLSWMETTGPRRRAARRPRRHHGPAPHGRTASARRGAARRGRPDALRRPGRHRGALHPRSLRGRRRSSTPSPAVSPSTPARTSSRGSAASTRSGCATSGSASVSRLASTSTTRTSTPRPGAATPSSAATGATELAALRPDRSVARRPGASGGLRVVRRIASSARERWAAASLLAARQLIATSGISSASASSSSGGGVQMRFLSRSVVDPGDGRPEPRGRRRLHRARSAPVHRQADRGGRADLLADRDHRDRSARSSACRRRARTWSARGSRSPSGAWRRRRPSTPARP